ncbi:MAG: 2-C-methyl-D-erythritol 4-phosphate cytidylyltransferase, partial [Clostridia bacterium]|nr:2-C-methyl-D-erythritol 4-phosphate cytidylyltransferase [Clostridia bacterium]
YYTDDGKTIGKLLNRDKIFAGQAPESFVFGKYVAINKAVSTEEINATRGSSEIAFKHGLSVKLVEGDEDNYKITTIADLEKFEDYIAEKNR